MRTRTLFDSLPRAHVSDPATSYEAAARVRNSHLGVVLAAVRRRPGRTSAEIAAAAEGAIPNDTYHEVARRLPELRRLGLVQHCGAPGCTGRCKGEFAWCERAVKAVGPTGRPAMCWWPRDRQGKESNNGPE